MAFARADVAIMPHGAHTASAIFMPRRGAAIEFNSVCDPRRHSWMKYFTPELEVALTWSFEGPCGPATACCLLTSTKFNS